MSREGRERRKRKKQVKMVHDIYVTGHREDDSSWAHFNWAIPGKGRVRTITFHSLKKGGLRYILVGYLDKDGKKVEEAYIERRVFVTKKGKRPVYNSTEAPGMVELLKLIAYPLTLF